MASGKKEKKKKNYMQFYRVLKLIITFGDKSALLNPVQNQLLNS